MSERTPSAGGAAPAAAAAGAAEQGQGQGQPGLAQRSAGFLAYLDGFVAGLPDLRLEEVIAAAGGPQRVAVVAVDVVNGFCRFGPLASERVGAIVPPIVRLLEAAAALGVTRVATLRDSHDPDAPEFGQFAPHCQTGTPEAELVDELKGLPLADTFTDVPKNATSAWHGQEAFSAWVEEQEGSGVTTFIVAGDCTDLCVYQTAVPLKLKANAENRRPAVIVAAQTVDTYDLPVDVARGLGTMPHDGDLLHAVFLYHLQLNGVQVVRRLVV
jgi:nicotinamidase-related amidase